MEPKLVATCRRGSGFIPDFCGVSWPEAGDEPPQPRRDAYRPGRSPDPSPSQPFFFGATAALLASDCLRVAAPMVSVAPPHPLMTKPKVFLTRPLIPAVLERLGRETELRIHADERPPTPTELLAGARGCDALLCCVADRVDAEFINAATGLRVIANFGVGYNNIDVAAATARRLPVTNTPGVLTEATADLAFALVLMSARRLGEGERLVRARKWTGWNPQQLLGVDVGGATFGLLGAGRIGLATARRARAFGMHLLYWNRTRLAAEVEAEHGLAYVARDELLRRADFLSIHVAYTPETHHLLGDAEFALMRPGAHVINTARGAILDEAALVRALRAGTIAGAGLDVFEREPRLEEELYAMENVVLLPHLGSATVGTRTRMGMIAVDNLLAACRGERPPNCVNPAVFG